MQSQLLEQVQDPGTVRASEWKTAAVQLPVIEIRGETIIFSYTKVQRTWLSIPGIEPKGNAIVELEIPTQIPSGRSREPGGTNEKTKQS